MTLWADIWRVSLWPLMKWLAVRPYYLWRGFVCCVFHEMAGYRAYREDTEDWYCVGCNRHFSYPSDL